MDKIQKGMDILLGNAMFSHLAPHLLLGELRRTTMIPTAATNGYHTLFNPSFAESLSEKEVAFVLAHEALHKAQCIWSYKDHPAGIELVNKALDLVVNQILVDMDPSATYIQMPADGLIDKKYKGWSTDDVIADLLKQRSKGSVATAGGGKNGGVFDEHIMDQQPSDAQMAEVSIASAISSRASDLLDNVVKMPPRKQDWRAMLNDQLRDLCAGTGSGWKPLRRMIHRGTDPMMIHSAQRRVPKSVCIAIDTSGSMNGLISSCLGYTMNILSSIGAKDTSVFCWDDAAHDIATKNRFETAETFIKRIPMKGGGGTSFGPAQKHIETIGSDVVIVITDGYIFDGVDRTQNHLWVIMPGGQKHPDMRRAVHVN